MYRRKAYDRLLEWKAISNGRSAILVDGARRVGKSTTVAEFARNEYDKCLVINFENCDPGIIKLFNDGFGQNVDMLLMKLQILTDVSLPPKKSVIVFDEVQFCPKARQAIKYLVADGRYDYIETGSLISIKKNVKDILIPSEEETLRMYPMDFEEYLWAKGDDISAEYVRTCFKDRIPVDGSIHKKLMDEFREYLVVGGMPQAVSVYFETHDIAKLESVKKSIIQLYLKDMAKMPTKKIGATKAIYEHVPSYLSKHSQVFSPGSIESDSRFRDYLDSFEWLSESRIVNRCIKCTDPGPLMGLNLELTRQKLYLSDTGLLVTLSSLQSGQDLNDIMRALMFGKLSVNTGMFVENFVAQEFAAKAHHLIFHEFTDKDTGKMYEVDFILSKGKKIAPVEVKSSKAVPHTSLDRFIKKYHGRIQESFILCSRNLEVSDDVTYLPIYMAMCL